MRELIWIATSHYTSQGVWARKLAVHLVHRGKDRELKFIDFVVVQYPTSRTDAGRLDNFFFFFNIVSFIRNVIVSVCEAGRSWKNCDLTIPALSLHQLMENKWISNTNSHILVIPCWWCWLFSKSAETISDSGNIWAADCGECIQRMCNYTIFLFHLSAFHHCLQTVNDRLMARLGGCSYIEYLIYQHKSFGRMK